MILLAFLHHAHTAQQAGRAMFLAGGQLDATLPFICLSNGLGMVMGTAVKSCILF